MEKIKCWYCAGIGIGSFFEPCPYCESMTKQEKEKFIKFNKKSVKNLVKGETK